MAVIEFSNVSKSFGEGTARTDVLKNIDLKVEDGEFLVLLGFSGTGKTTLINLMAGLEKPTKGTVTYRGQPIDGPGRERGVIFQNYSLMPWLTVNGNVQLAVDTVFPGMSRAEKAEKVAHYVKMVGLGHAATRRPAELSGGMRQRVGLARALAVNADVLLMDEPFSAVDEQTRRKFQEDLLALVQNEKKTFIFVTHSIEEAVYVSDQIAILLPRPSRVSEIIRPSNFRNKGIDNIRRDPEYLDIVDEIWASLRTYVE